MPKNEQTLKWPCEYCTYLNWPSASQCVMCRAQNGGTMAIGSSRNTSRRASPTQDIYEASVDTGTSISRSSSDELICPGDNGKNIPRKTIQEVKWTCGQCTYRNWPKADRCTLCRATKPHRFRNVESQKNKENNVEAGIKSSKTSIHKHEASKESKRDRPKATSRNCRWVCPSCTYENWPKNLKCTLCMHAKPKIKQDDLVNKSTADKIIGNRSRHGSSPRRSPPRSPNSDVKVSGDITYDSGRADEAQILELSNIMAASCRLRANESDDIKQIRNRMSSMDWLWLAACKGIVDPNPTAVMAYLRAGGDRTRVLTVEDLLVLQEPGHYEVGHTLVHLAIKYQREDILRILLKPECSPRALKRLPSHVSPELAAAIRKQVAFAIRQRKSDFLCPYFTESFTFSLPAEIREFEVPIQHQLFSEILDIDVQKVLEGESLINWSDELSGQYGSRIYPLWNRAAGDCLLDSILQATWGVLDNENMLRKALYESLCEGKKRFFPRWREAEEMQASEMNYALDEEQWKQAWCNLICLAETAGNSLEQMHVFALAHILRRPIIVYAVKYVKSFRGETIDFARFEGVYLPLLWDEGFCDRNPIALGYTRGHFSALVSMEALNDNFAGARANVDWNEDSHITYLPLVDHEGRVLPIHFLTMEEVGQEERLLQSRIDCCLTDNGILVAKQRSNPRPALVNQMIDEWLHRFRKMQEELLEKRGAYKI